MQNFGIDISRWQGNFPIQQAVKEGVQFVIAKAGGSDSGRYKDSQFEANYNKCKELGIPVGAYYFGKDRSVAEAEASADHFISILAGKQLELPVYYDVEHREMLMMGKDRLTEVIKAFCSKLEKAGYYVGIYSSQSYFSTYMNDKELKGYTHWVAAWTSNKPRLASGNSVDMWQFGGEVNKIRSNRLCNMTVDQDYLYVDFTSAIKRYGLNGFPKPTVEDRIPDTPRILSIEEIVFDGNGSRSIIRGLFDDYNIAKQMAREIYKDDNAGVNKTFVHIYWRPANRIDEGGIAFTIENGEEKEYLV